MNLQFSTKLWQSLILMGLVFFGGVSQGTSSIEEKSLETINFIENVFEDRYAPRDWKAKHIGWSLKVESDKARASIQKLGANLTLKSAQDVLRDLLGSVKDYHVGIFFYGTEKATLPLEIRSAEGKFFIAWIDRKKLSENSFPFKVGDQLSQFNGHPVEEERQAVLKYIRQNVPETDLAFAEMMLTRRSTRMGMPVPRGPVDLEVVRKVDGEEKKISHQLIWEYKEELINTMAAPARSNGPVKAKHWLNRSMELGSWQAISGLWDAEDDNPHQFGGKKSYVPKLGKVIWENDADKKFHAYIFRSEHGLVGFIRIPTYGAGEEHAAEFLEIIKKMEEQTDALVIDQVNNPGGSVFYLYALAAMLTDRPLATPLHRVTITQEDVQSAVEDLEKLEKVKSEEDAQKELGETLGGYPVSYEVAQFFKENARFILEQWQSGVRLSTPYYLGIDKILPHPKGHYSKPILVLINESDFSGGDFFPAILQDNERATLMGVRTAGAGGYVKSISFPNLLGLAGFSVTGSLAERVDKNPIENLGVKPDVDYALTADDMQKGYEPYKKKILEQVKTLLGK